MPGREQTHLTSHALRICVPGRTLVDELEVEFAGGEFVAVLGQNGTGKTLSMLTLAGLRAPDAGYVSLNNAPMGSLRRVDIARRLALLPQDVDDAFPSTVLDTVLTGRHPHIGRWQWESMQDRDIAAHALRSVGLDELAARDVATLSGGERRRVAVAQILAQAPDVYLLDEPTNHLDPQHQLDVLELFRTLAGNGKTIVASLHDVNLAARFADRCLLLFGDGRWVIGESAEILNEPRLSELYGTSIESLMWHDQKLFVAVGD